MASTDTRPPLGRRGAVPGEIQAIKRPAGLCGGRSGGGRGRERERGLAALDHPLLHGDAPLHEEAHLHQVKGQITPAPLGGQEAEETRATLPRAAVSRKRTWRQVATLPLFEGSRPPPPTGVDPLFEGVEVLRTSPRSFGPRRRARARRRQAPRSSGAVRRRQAPLGAWRRQAPAPSGAVGAVRRREAPSGASDDVSS